MREIEIVRERDRESGGYFAHDFPNLAVELIVDCSCRCPEAEIQKKSCLWKVEHFTSVNPKLHFQIIYLKLDAAQTLEKLHKKIAQ